MRQRLQKYFKKRTQTGAAQIARGSHPLLVAAENKSLREVKSLLKQGVHPDQSDSNGWTPLHIAANNNSLEMGILLLEYKADVSKPNRNGQTALHLAVEDPPYPKGCPKDADYSLVKALLKREANPNQLDTSKRTPFHIAVENGDLKLVDLLLEHGADPNLPNSKGEAPIIMAALNGDLDMVALLLRHKATDQNIRDAEGRTAFFIAASDDDMEMMKLLLGKIQPFTTFTSLLEDKTDFLSLAVSFKKKKANPDIPDSKGETPFFAAGLRFAYEVIQLLIDEGVDPHQRNSKGETLLFVAAQLGYIELVRVLLKKKVNPDCPNSNGETPIFAAASKGLLKTAKLLLKKGAKPNQQNSNGETPLFVAACEGHVELVRLLLNQKKAKPDLPNSQGETPIFAALRQGRLRVVQLLLEAGVDPHQRNSGGETLLYVAAKHGYLAVVKLLLEKGAKPPDELNSDGENPLLIAAKLGHLDVLQVLLEEKGAPHQSNPNLRESPLLVAAREGRLRVVQALIQKGANLNPSLTGTTPLLEAIKKGHRAIVEELLKLIIIPNQAITPKSLEILARALVLAVQENQLEIVELLLEQGAHPNKPNTKGETPLLAAVEQSRIGIAQVLLKRGADLNQLSPRKKAQLFVAAVRGKYGSLVRFLFDQGADLNWLSEEDKAELFIHVVQSRNIEFAQILLKRDVALLAQNYNGRAVLLWATGGCDADLIKALLKNIADVHKLNCDGENLLFAAGKLGQANLLEVLLEEKRVNPNQMDSNGETLLSVVARTGLRQTIIVLLAWGANPNLANSNGETPLFIVAREGQLEVVQILLQAKANLNQLSEDQKTKLLMTAVHRNNLGFVQFFIERGANPNLQDSNGQTPLFVAAKNRRLDMTQVLLEQGADLNLLSEADKVELFINAVKGKNLKLVQQMLKKEVGILTRDYQGKPLFLSVIGMCDVPMVRVMLQNILDLNQPNFDRERLFFVAAERGYLNLLQGLLEEKEVDLNQLKLNGKTLLFVAARNKHLNVVQVLLEKGVDFNQLSLGDKADLFIEAVKEKNLTLVQILLQKDSHLLTHNYFGNNLLLLAAKVCDVTMVRVMLENLALLEQPFDWQTQLFIAAEQGQVSLIQAWFEEKRIDSNPLNSKGETLLFVAASSGYTQIVHLLLEQGADPNQPNSNGETPILGAARYNHLEAIQALIETGAKIHQLMEVQQAELLIAAVLRNNLRFLDYFIDKGVHPDQRDSKGRTPFFMATQIGSLEAARILLEKGADLNQLPKNAQAQLFIAAISGQNLKLVRLLIDIGVNPDQLDSNGKTQLSIAARNKQLNVVQVLLEKGADFNQLSLGEKAELFIDAVKGKNLGLTQLLLQKDSQLLTQYYYGNSLLLLAAKVCDLAMLRAMLENRDLLKQPFNWRELLFTAVQQGHANLIQILQEKGFDLTQQKLDGETLLFVAASHGYVPIVHLLIAQGADANQPNSNGETPIVGAARYDHLEVVQTLLERGEAKLGEISNDKRAELLIAAALRENLGFLQFFIDKGVPPDQMDSKGRTPLFVAVQVDSLEVARILVEKGADLNQLFLNEQIRLFVTAASKQNLGLLNLLIEKGMSPDQFPINEQAHLFMGAVSHHNLGLVKILFGKCKIDEVLVYLRAESAELERIIQTKKEEKGQHTAHFFGATATKKSDLAEPENLPRRKQLLDKTAEILNHLLDPATQAAATTATTGEKTKFLQR